MNLKFTEKIGYYSGNKRLDSSNLEEPTYDNEKTLEKWLGGKRDIKVNWRLKRWKRNISETCDPDLIRVHMVGQSHIDCAWMWRFEQTRKKAQVTFKKAVLHAKMFPETFKFALSEPLLLEWIKKDNPELFTQIQESVKKGNIELVGGSYVEPDCMMPSGEAFIRQRLYGMRFFRDHFGLLPEVEWFLDSFGYNLGLPQILAKSGAKYFWTSKLTWNLDTTFPFVNFWWQGPDGTKILTANFHMDTQVLEDWSKFEIGRHLLKKNGKKTWNYTMDYSKLDEHVKEEICPHVGCFFGIGDGGHGPTHKEVAYANELKKLKMFKWSSVKDFYDEIDMYSKEFPIWNDELYLENHRGCFSNHSAVKRHNRKYQNTISSLEALSVITYLINSDYQYPINQLENLWKITLKNQFHDVLPGSSIPEVYDEVWDDWEKQDGIIENIIHTVGSTLADEKEKKSSQMNADLYLFNPLSWERTSRVFIPLKIFNKNIKLDKEGRPNYATLTLLSDINTQYICQPIVTEPESTVDRMPAGWWTVVKLKPLSLTPARITLLNDLENEKIRKQESIEITESSIKNNFISIKLDPKTGAIVELKAKIINNGNNLLSGNSSNLTYGFLDADTRFPAWNLHPEYWNHPIDLSNEKQLKIQISELGPIFATLEITRKFGESPVIQKIILFRDCPEVFLEYLTDWKQKNVMLKVLYSTTTRAEIATADAAYCAIKFKTNPEVLSDKSRYEKVCHNYFDVSTPENGWGLALLNEGKYAFDVNGGDMRLTMLRSCQYPPPAPEAWVNMERTENEKLFNHKVPKFSGLGPFKCRYALLPHNGGALIDSNGNPNVIVKRKAEEFNNPIMIIHANSINGSQTKLLNSGKSFLEILTPNIYLGALKMNEWNNKGTIVVRFIEGCGISTIVNVKFNDRISKKISEIKAIDLLEREIEYKFEWNQNNGTLTFEIGKFEICSFDLSF